MTAKADIDLVRRQNRALILQVLRRRGATARTGLAEATGLSSATVSAITAEMLAEGVLERRAAGTRTSGRGRPQMPLAVAADHAAVLAIGVWVGKMSLSLYDHRGGLTARRDAPPLDPDMGAAAMAAAICDAAAGFLAGRPQAARLAAIPVAVQGVTDGAGRAIHWSPILATADFDLAGALESRFGVPAQVMNDCAAMAQTLHWRDPGRYSRDFAVVLIGYGVGMGLFVQGRPFRGQSSSAVEFGHMNHLPGGAPCRCGRLGCVEAYAADYAIWRAARGPRAPAFDAGPDAAGLQDTGPVSDEAMAALAARARAGEPLARGAYAGAGRALGFGLGRVFALIGAMRVVFVGRGATAFDLMQADIRAGLREALVPALSGELDAEVIEDSEGLALEGLMLTALAALDARGAGAARPPGAGSGPYAAPRAPPSAEPSDIAAPAPGRNAPPAPPRTETPNGDPTS